MTQRELADLSGVPKGSIGNYENGSYCPRPKNLWKLIRVFGNELLDCDTKLV